MAHSHDRTYLASLGFADPDKKLSEHDLACQYLGQESNQKKLAELVEREVYKNTTGNFTINKPSFEIPITKGLEQYKTTIGFLDLAFYYNYKSGKKDKWSGVIVEVKISKVAMSDVIRQIKFYRQYTHELTSKLNMYNFVLVTKFDITQEDLCMLQSANISWIKLGKSFKEFVEMQQSDDAEMAHGEEI